VLLKVVYLLTCRLLGLAVLVFRSDLAKDAELRNVLGGVINEYYQAALG